MNFIKQQKINDFTNVWKKVENGLKWEMAGKRNIEKLEWKVIGKGKFGKSIFRGK